MVSPLPSDHFVNVLKRAKQADSLGERITKAIQLIDAVLDNLDEKAVALSFNGGKDCTVLLHLFAATLYARHASDISDLRPARQHIEIPRLARPSTDSSIPTPACASSSTLSQPAPTTTSSPSHSVGDSLLPYPSIKSVYITAPNHFEELDTFTDDSVIRYGLDLYRFGGDMKAALKEYLECGGGKGVKGVLVGTRTGDPNGRKSDRSSDRELCSF